MYANNAGAFVSKYSVTILLFFAALSGCMGENPKAGMDALEAKTTAVANETRLVDYFSSASFGTDLGRAGCELQSLTQGEESGKWFLKRIRGSKVSASHTKLLFTLDIENAFSEFGDGFRVGAYYNHELVFWSDGFAESTSFEYEIDGTMPDLNKDQSWTFFFKRTDPLTKDDPNACSSGKFSGSIGVQIDAR